MVYKGNITSIKCRLDKSTQTRYRENYRKLETSYIDINSNGVYFISFVDLKDNLIVVGPAAIDKLSFEENHSFRNNYHIRNEEFKVLVIPLIMGLNIIAIQSYFGERF